MEAWTEPATSCAPYAPNYFQRIEDVAGESGFVEVTKT